MTLADLKVEYHRLGEVQDDLQRRLDKVIRERKLLLLGMAAMHRGKNWQPKDELKKMESEPVVAPFSSSSSPAIDAKKE